MRKKYLILCAMIVAMTLCAILPAAYADANAKKENKAPEPTVVLTEASTAAPSAAPTIAPAKAEDFELPIHGATGYTSISMALKAEPSKKAKTANTLKAGTAFQIIKEQGDWWLIQTETVSGWLQHKFCMLNLPDVIPSILYDNTNTYSSKFRSSGKPIPGITGEALYEGKVYNPRLGKNEYVMPVLYLMAKKIFAAQQYALNEGNSLLIYESYRPRSAQKAVLEGLTKLAKSDSEVMKGINASPWSLSWFIAKSISNHQRGCAIDVSLVKIESKIDTWVGSYLYPQITSYTEYTMPTPIHELSIASVAFSTPVESQSTTAWKNAKLASSMNDAAISLQTYCTMAGLTPLASEWWHFNDLHTLKETAGNRSDGCYELTECYSSVP